MQKSLLGARAPRFYRVDAKQPSGLRSRSVRGREISAPSHVRGAKLPHRRQGFGVLALYSLVLLSTTACDKTEATATEAAQTPVAAAPAPKPEKVDPAATAKQIFSQRCVVCHGDSGSGDGPGAAALNPKPRAFSDSAWQASVTDEQLATTIVQGGAAVGKSPIMPGNPELKRQPEVVAELIKVIRGYGK